MKSSTPQKQTTDKRLLTTKVSTTTQNPIKSSEIFHMLISNPETISNTEFRYATRVGALVVGAISALLRAFVPQKFYILLFLFFLVGLPLPLMLDFNNIIFLNRFACGLVLRGILGGKSGSNKMTLLVASATPGTLPHNSFFVRTLESMFSSTITQTYYSLALYLLLAFAICALLATRAYLFALSAVQDSEKRSEYECGFEPFDSATRLPFDVHFYLVGILFLIFDVEIALLFPWVLGLRTIGWFGFYLRLGFIVLLSIGFLYEWKRGALIWPSRQKEMIYVPSLVVFTTSDANVFNTLVDLILTSTFLYGQQLAQYFVPERTLALGLTYLLTTLALDLGKGISKKALAIESLTAVQWLLVRVARMYVVQLVPCESFELFNGYRISNRVTTRLKLVTVLAGVFRLNNSMLYVQENSRHLLEYAIVRTLALLFILLLVSSANLRSAFLAIVGFSLNLYVLILFDAPTFAARESGVKYYYLSTFSSGLIIYGIFLLFITLKTGSFHEIAQILGTCKDLVQTHHFLLQAGTLLLLTGVFFKLSAFPGHLWAAEVYEGSSDPVTGFFRLPVKIAALAFLSSLLSIALEPIANRWQPYVAFSASRSLIWGCFGALYEKKTKRFLAYASINQIGFLLLGLACASLGGYRSTLIYLLIYSVRNFSFLVLFLNARREDGRGLLYITDFRGLGTSNWLLSWSLAITLFSRAGIPPLAGFFGKYFLLVHVFEQELYGLAVVALSTSLFSAYYYIRLIKTLWFEGRDGRTSVTCSLTFVQQTCLFLVEARLFSFIIFSGVLVEQRTAIILNFV